ncbi:MAG: polysaccharide biosynthesis C-terminal domain-containing protein [Candidatus Aminicenantes bacterium]|jgi:O-antigen/teichoic acid export membrane protein
MKEEAAADFNMMLKASGFAGAGKMADIFFRYSTSVVLTRILGAEVFGIFLLGRTMTMVTGLICKFGMGYGAVRQIAFYAAKNDENNVQQAIRLALLVPGMISIITAALLLWAGDDIAIGLFKKPALALPLKLLVFTIPIITILYILLDVVRGFKKITLRVVVENYLLPLSNLLMISIFYLLGYRLEGAISAFIVSNVVSLTILIFLNRKRIKITGPAPFIKKKSAFEFFKFSLPLAFVNILAELKNRLDVLFLGLLSTASNTSIFFIALRLANLLSLPWQASNMIFAPMVSGYFARDDIEKIEYNYKNITKMMFTVTMFFWGFIMVFSRELLSIFGAEFKQGAGVVALICLGQLVKSLVGNAGPMLAMMGKSLLNLVIMIVTLALLVILNLLLIPKYGIIGAGIANLTTVTVTSLLELYFIYYLLHIHPFKKDFIKPVIAALIGSGGIYLLKKIISGNVFSTLLLMLVFAVLYFTILYLQGLSREEMALLTGFKQRVLHWKQ